MFVVPDEVGWGNSCIGLVEVVEEVKDREVCVTKVRLFNGAKVDFVDGGKNLFLKRILEADILSKFAFVGIVLLVGHSDLRSGHSCCVGWSWVLWWLVGGR